MAVRGLIVALLLTAASSAQRPHPLVPGAVSGIEYKPGLLLDAYAPAGDPRPAAVIFHGSRGNRFTYVNQLFEVLDRAGYAWFSADYKTLDDARAALQYIQRSSRFNISKTVVVIGEDTGAQIAVQAAPASARVVLLGAKFDQSANRSLPSAMLMIHGAADRESPPEKLQQTCKAQEGCEFYPVAGAIHNFENWHPDQWHWKERLTAWLRADRRGIWKEIAYARPMGLELRMDASIPFGPGPFPAVIVVHGGGWEAGDRTTYAAPVFQPLADAKFAWFSIDYRLTPHVRNPEQLEDLRTAIRYVREHAAWFQVDPKRIAILGESASGQMVTQVAAESCSGCEVQAVVSFYGVYNFTTWPEIQGRRAQLGRLFGEWTPEILRRYSPIYGAHAKMPPVLIIQGTKEALYEPALEYAAKLKEVGARHEVLLLEGAPHGMENWEGHPEWLIYQKKLVEWLKAAMP